MTKIYNIDCLEYLKSVSCLEDFKGKRVILVTDPPYNMGYHYNEYSDNKDENEYYEWLDKICYSYNFEGLVFLHYPENLYKLSFRLGLFPKKICSWVYNSNTPKQHRDIAYFKISPDMSQMTQEYKNLNDKRIQERIKNGCLGGKLYDWWEINQVKNVSNEKYNHPCIIPLAVMKNVVGVLPKDCIIFDPFLGTGTTGVACKELGYDFIGCELNEDYFKIATDKLNGISPNGQTSIFTNFEVNYD